MWGTWLRKYSFVKGSDFTVFNNSIENLGQGGRPRKEYHVTVNMAKERFSPPEIKLRRRIHG
ncbi:MAG: antA/AntB antirepressor family protein [candidate division Zixibacteria bacterium]